MPGKFSWWLDTFCDLYFVSDLISNFFLSFSDPHDGTVVYDRREIAKRYLKGCESLLQAAFPVPLLTSVLLR